MSNKYLINYCVLYGSTLLDCYLITEDLRNLSEQIEEHFRNAFPLYEEVCKIFPFSPYSIKCFQLHEIDPDVEVVYMIEEEINE